MYGNKQFDNKQFGNKQFGSKQPTATTDTGRRRSRLPDLHALHLARGRGASWKASCELEGELRAGRQAPKLFLSKRIVKIVLRLGKK